jgi:hypothetical protein
MKLLCNCCDGLYNSFDVHFTSACDNRCAHCIDTRYAGKGISQPDPDAIIKTILENQDGFDDVLFLGGEPCLYLDDLVYTVKELTKRTSLKLYVTTAVPKICHDKYSLFCSLLGYLDGYNLSVQSHDEVSADLIRRTTSRFDRQAFYNSLPFKSRMRINLNLVRPYLCTKEQLSECLYHYDKLNPASIKISEIQHGVDNYVSFEKLFNLKLCSPYSSGCQTYLDTPEILPGLKTKLLLKRSCFLCEDSLKASCADLIKGIAQVFVKPTNKYAVIYEDGTLEKGWK